MSTRRERAKAQSAQQSKQMAVAVAKPVKEHPFLVKHRSRLSSSVVWYVFN